jgi:hypothetical protein
MVKTTESAKIGDKTQYDRVYCSTESQLMNDCVYIEPQESRLKSEK